MSTTGVRWRYLRLLMGEDADIAWLDALGDQGWELVCRNLVSGQIGVYEWLFKRMVLEHPAVVQSALENVPLMAMADESARLAAEHGTADWPTLEQIKREHGMQHVAQTVERTRKGWSEEARARARERGKAQAAKRKAAQDATVERTDAPGVSGAPGDEGAGV